MNSLDRVSCRRFAAGSVLGACLLALLSPVTAASASPAAAVTPEALSVLQRSLAAYARMAEMHGRTAFEIEFPDGRREKKEMRYGRRGADAFMALVLPDGSRVLELVAAGDRLFASQFNVRRAYVDAAYGGDLLAAMRAIGTDQVGLKAPPPLAAALTGAGGEVGPFLDALGFGVLGPLEPRTVRAVEGPDGGGLEVELRASNGTCRVLFDAETSLLKSFTIEVGEPGHQVRGEGTFEALDLAALGRQLTFDPAGRSPVADFAALEASAYPLGQPAPDEALPSLGGETVRLAELRGSVVVLDFWATWCVPCWKALGEIEKLARWAQDSSRQVVVYAVSTQEQTAGLEAQRVKVREFLTGRGLSLPVLLDADGSFFTALSSPGLPSTVVIAPDGTLARYHSGVMENMFEVLQREVTELQP